MLKCELHIETNLSQKENQSIHKRHRPSCNDITVLTANAVSQVSNGSSFSQKPVHTDGP